jgi:hypothetical protein
MMMNGSFPDATASGEWGVGWVVGEVFFADLAASRS